MLRARLKTHGLKCVPVDWSVRVEWHVYPWIEVYEWSDMCTCGLKCTSGVTCVPVDWSVRVKWHVYPWIEVYEWSDMCTCGVLCTIKTKTWLLYIYIVWTPSWYPVSVSSWFLKPSSEVAQATCGGSLFQSPMVRGKNEYL